MHRYVSGYVAVYDRHKVPGPRVTKKGLREALQAHPGLDFRTDEGYVNLRGMVEHELTLEVRDGANLVAVVEAKREGTSFVAVVR